MKRNMITTANKAKGKIATNFDICATDLMELKEMIDTSENKNEALYTALLTAYNYGYVLGGRAVAKGNKVL